MGRFWGYLGGAIVKPHRTFNRLLDDPMQLRFSLLAVLFIGLLYTLSVIGLAIIKADISASAWITIPADKYYFWEMGTQIIDLQREQ